MLNLHYENWSEKLKSVKNERKKYLMVNDYTLDKLLDKFKRIDN